MLGGGGVVVRTRSEWKRNLLSSVPAKALGRAAVPPASLRTEPAASRPIPILSASYRKHKRPICKFLGPGPGRCTAAHWEAEP